MYRGKIHIPSDFLALAANSEVHLLVLQEKALFLFPTTMIDRESIDSEIASLRDQHLEVNYLYLGTQRINKDGKIYIPERARKICGLKSKQIMIVGVLNHIVIWDLDRWNEEMERARKDMESELDDLF